MTSKNKIYIIGFATVTLLMILILFYSSNENDKYPPGGPIVDSVSVPNPVPQNPRLDSLIQQYDAHPWDLTHKTDFYLPNLTKIEVDFTTGEMTEEQADYYTTYLNDFYAKKMIDWVENNLPRSYDPGKFRAIATEMEELLSHSGGKISPNSIDDCRKSIGMINDLNSYLSRFTYFFKELAEVDDAAEYLAFYNDTYIPIVDEKRGLNILLHSNPEVKSKCAQAERQTKVKAESI
jgi:hypothetical protein